MYMYIVHVYAQYNNAYMYSTSVRCTLHVVYCNSYLYR